MRDSQPIIITTIHTKYTHLNSVTSIRDSQPIIITTIHTKYTHLNSVTSTRVRVSLSPGAVCITGMAAKPTTNTLDIELSVLTSATLLETRASA